MDKTIAYMKKKDLFTSLVDDAITGQLTIGNLPDVLDYYCENDYNFEDILLNDLHEIGNKILWEAIQEAVNNVPEKKESNVEIKELLKQIIELL